MGMRSEHRKLPERIAGVEEVHIVAGVVVHTEVGEGEPTGNINHESKDYILDLEFSKSEIATTNEKLPSRRITTT